MADFYEIEPQELKVSPFQLIGHDWLLITAANGDKVNTMTASWGGLGVMWGKNVAQIVIRPQRYTKEFVDSSETFSLSFYHEGFKSKLGYLGKVSGRDEDKIAKAELHTVFDGKTPYFEEAEMVLICKKLFHQNLNPEGFIGKELDTRWYPEKDYHTLYFGEVEKILLKKSV